ncbi:TetR/AcrR family transcriptional regulator [Chitinivorax sp. PXF-14]|uniref:TetR/AcrR family transcriptional regulator n=1 Tax=Chitinivorax sp. PXF-14 TaxID=3230488 RepID=UPI003467D352
MKTRDRIIQSGLQLFNEHSERLVTTNHIAANLGISPGNLYYHFRNKEEIIRDIFTEYRDYMSKRLQAPMAAEVTSDFLSNYLDAVFDTLWRYRFLFYDLPGFVERDPKLAELHHDFQRDVIVPSLIRIHHQLSGLGWFNWPSEDLIGVVLNAQVISNNWFSFERALRPNTPITEAACKRAIGQVLIAMRPYVTSQYRLQFEAIYERFRYDYQDLLAGSDVPKA